MRDWLARRPREGGRPAYDLAEFGLTPDEVSREMSVLTFQLLGSAHASRGHGRAARARARRARAARAPDGAGRTRLGGRDLARRGRRRRDAMRERFEAAFDEVMFSAAVWSSNQDPLRPKVDLHHPARAPGRGTAGAGLAVGHRQPRHGLPRHPDLRRRALRAAGPGRCRSPHRELLHPLGPAHGHRRRPGRSPDAGRGRRLLRDHRGRRRGRRAAQPHPVRPDGARALHPRRAARLGPRRLQPPRGAPPGR